MCGVVLNIWTSGLTTSLAIIRYTGASNKPVTNIYTGTQVAISRFSVLNPMYPYYLMDIIMRTPSDSAFGPTIGLYKGHIVLKCRYSDWLMDSL